MWDFTVKINTPENTEIEFELAGIGNRFAAMIVDYLLIAVILAIIYVFCAILVFIFKDIISDISEKIAAIMLLATFFVGFNGYFIIFEYLWSGQTPGKRLLGIRVIRENGQPVGFMEVFLRNILRIIDVLIGPYFVLFSRNEKRLGDYSIGTIVVKEKDVSVPIVDTEVPEGFKADIPNISKLTPKDFTLIANFLKRKDQFEFSARDSLLEEFVTFYFDKLAIDSSMTNVEDVEDLTYEDKLSWLEKIYYCYKVRGTMISEAGGVS